ncbi:MAG: hypothetical protein A3G87_08310 [Omnitrophica bacterium RIFCSPLOWO2_12_FULL_50_11]|nr:MAG: hypothetical protein A3G87_08310 [Omnitrophica bacterium RIFCSPLOWO2_12_FULL_50_11]
MKRILVIEDEPQLAEVLGENLREDGYEVVLAGNGQEGLRKVQLTKPDLIILDVVMPKMDGAETYAHLQDSEKTKHIPVIFLTGLKTKVDDFMLGQEVGTHTIFSKPFDHEELLGTIREMTSGK